MSLEGKKRRASSSLGNSLVVESCNVPKNSFLASNIENLENIKNISKNLENSKNISEEIYENHKNNLIQVVIQDYENQNSLPRIPVTIRIGEKIISAPALLDSGAAQNLLDESFARKHLIPLKTRKEQSCLVLADGTKSKFGPIKHETHEIPVTLPESSSLDPVSCQFAIMHSPRNPVILGYPWFKQCNPRINWSTLEINLACTHQFESRSTETHSELSSYTVQSEEVPEISNSSGNTASHTGTLHWLGSSIDDDEDFDDSVDLTKLPAKYHSFVDVFSKTQANKLPHERIYDCEIILKNPESCPPFKPLYNLSPEEMKALDEYIKENLAKGFIRPSKSPSGAPIFFVKKKDGSLRPCIDYRDLNEMTVKNRYPLPLLQDLLDRLVHAKVFTKIDLRGAYNLVRMKPGDEWKTAFRSRYGHFEYLVMPFGLTNAPAVFQHMMNDIFRDMIDIFVIVYLDDILIFSPDQETHDTHVKMVLSRLRENSLYAKLEKCSFDQDTVEYLGYIISPHGISMARDKVETIATWKQPDSKRAVQSFLGFANFYRRFVRNYSSLVKPLTDLTRSNSEFLWTDEATHAFEALKSAILSGPILLHPDPTKPFTVETDASDFAIGAVLSQESAFTKKLHPVAFFSRKLLPAELNYTVHDKELLAIVNALKHWRHYLVGSHHIIDIFSDHKNLTFFQTRRLLKQRHARWSEILSEFNFRLCYRPGKLNTVADALSRRSDFIEEGDNLTSKQELLLLPESQFQEVHTVDINDNLTHEEKIEILKSRHDNITAGHPGRWKTYQAIRKDFNWPGLKKMVFDYVDGCEICQRNKSSRHKPYGLLEPLPIGERPWGSLSMDFVVKLPESHGNDSILVVTCRMTKMAHFIACKESITSEELTKIFISNIVKYHGLPDYIVSDRGPVFTSAFWNTLLKSLNIKSQKSTAFHPQTDGQTERVNQCMEQYLRCYVSYQQDDWYDLLPMAEFAYNSSIHATIKTSPFYANYGFHPKTDFLADHNSEQVPRVFDNLKQIEEVQKKIFGLLKTAQDTQKKYADRKRQDHNFKCGDQVWLLRKNIKTTRPCEKLDNKKIGPFKIIEEINPVAFKLKLPVSLKIHPVFHVSLLEKYYNPRYEHQKNSQPPPEIIDGQEEYVVEAILDSRFRKKKLQYLVKWEGYSDCDNSWEPVKNLENAPQKIEEFHKKYPKKPGIDQARGTRS